MNERRNIALIGLNGLETLGLRWLIHEEHDCKVESYVDFKEFQSCSEERDGYVVTAEIFASNVDFFLPRKPKTLVVARGSGSRSHAAGVNILYTHSDLTEMKTGLSLIFRNMEEGESLPGNLSVRETEVLRLIASGKINKEIADALCISINTVITHRKNISSKLGIKSASGLSLYAMMNGII